MNDHSIATLDRDSDGKLPTYAWPGGYPFIYYSKQGEVFCAECATAEVDDPDNAPDSSILDPVTYWDVYYEGPPEQCCNCGNDIESAYGDPDDTEDSDPDNQDD